MRLWDLKSAQVRVLLQGHLQPVTATVFSPDGRSLASGAGEVGKPGELRLWDVETGAELVALRGHTREVNAVGFDVAGRRLVSTGADGTVRVWSTGPQTPRRLHGFPFDVTALAFQPEGSLLAIAVGGLPDRYFDGEVHLLEYQTGVERATLRYPGGGVRELVISRDGQTLAIGGPEGFIYVYDLPAKTLRHQLHGRRRSPGPRRQAPRRIIPDRQYHRQ